MNWISDIFKFFKKQSGAGMVDYSDWFEQTNGIPIVASQKNPETEIFNRVEEIFKFLEAVQAKDFNGDLIVDKARADYISNIKSRALRFFDQTTALKLKIDTDALRAPPPSHFREDLRDFYHSSYYCLYFCARYYLISSKQLDTNIHDKIHQYLEKFALRDPSQTLAGRFVVALKTMQGYRNKADYNMAGKIIAELADANALSDTITVVTNLTKDCGVR